METYNNVPKSRIKMPEYRYFHIFTHNSDDYIPYTDENKPDKLKEIEAMRDSWVESGTEDIRIYDVVELTDPYDGELYVDQENCIFSCGEFPS